MSIQGLPENMETRVRRAENCALSTVRRVAAMLDLNQNMFLEGQPLPRGWQFILLGADTPRLNLRGDGFPGFGVPLPDLGLPRLMLGGRKVRYLNDITIGETLTRESYVEKVSNKETAAGPMAIVTIAHTMTSEIAGEVLSETQTYLMLNAQTGERKMSDGPGLPDIADLTETIPDDLLLFQYSALGFNSHRIHWDREFARNTEGFPDLVVNGGLATLLLTEHLRQRHGSGFTSLSAKHTSPLFASRPLHMAASERDGGWLLQAFDVEGRPAVEIETTT
jgi:3-methylfumaryl-CoA hydratase